VSQFCSISVINQTLNCVCRKYVMSVSACICRQAFVDALKKKAFRPVHYTCSRLVDFHVILCRNLNRRCRGEFNCVLIPGWDKSVFLLQKVQKGCGTQPLFYPKCTGGSLPEDKTLGMSDLPVSSI
jgi:hypothetical protein